jgi:hypothetical protein
VGKSGARGIPGSPNSSFPRTTTSGDLAADDMSPTTALWGGSESGPLKAFTRVALLEAEGVGGLGQAVER